MVEHDPPEVRLLATEDDIGDGWLLTDPDATERTGRSRRRTPTGLTRALPPWLRSAAGRRRWRWTAVVAVGLLVVAGSVLRQHRVVSRQRVTAAAATPPLIAPPISPTPSPTGTGLPWPQATGACNGQFLLPQVTSRPLREPTGITLSVSGGNAVRAVALDSAAQPRTPLLAVPARNFVSELASGGTASHPLTYALIGECDQGITDDQTVMRFGPGETPRVAAIGPGLIDLLSDQTGGVWLSQAPPTLAEGPIEVRRLGGGPKVTLPAGVVPIAIDHSSLVGLRSSPVLDGNQPGELSVQDLRGGRVAKDLGPATGVSVGAGLLLWTNGACSANGPCQVHRYDLRTGATSVRGYSLPVEASLSAGVISPDRTKLAFSLPREFGDPRFAVDGPGAPADLVVLDLRTGTLEGVPNLELPPKTSVGMVFSADSRWLVIGLNEGSSTRLLTWRSGQPQPLASPVALPGPLAGAPSLLLTG